MVLRYTVPSVRVIEVADNHPNNNFAARLFYFITKYKLDDATAYTYSVKAPQFMIDSKVSTPNSRRFISLLSIDVKKTNSANAPSLNE